MTNITDTENSMVTQGCPEHEDAREMTPLEKAEARTKLWEEIANGDLLDLYLEAGFTGLSDRLIQGAVRRCVDGRLGDELQIVFDKHLLKNHSQFIIMFDILVRRHLDASQRDFSAFNIGHSVERCVKELIDKKVEGAL